MNPRYYRYYTYIKPIINNKKVKSYSNIVFTIVTISIFLFFAIRPTITTILSLQRSITEQQQVLEQLKLKAENITTGKKNYDQLPSDVKQKLVTLLPEKVEIATIVNNLNTLSLQNQASISGLQFQQIEITQPTQVTVASPKLQEIAFNFNLQGEYLNLLKVLETFTQTNRLITIESVNLNKSNEGDALIMTINAKGYYLKNN